MPLYVGRAKPHHQWPCLCAALKTWGYRAQLACFEHHRMNILINALNELVNRLSRSLSWLLLDNPGNFLNPLQTLPSVPHQQNLHGIGKSSLILL
jgi:hypothetical protein